MVKKLQALKAKKGFTLVELIVVIAIIGVLAAILVPTMLGMVTKSRVTSMDSTTASIVKQIDTFMTDADTAGYGMKKVSGSVAYFTFEVTSSSGVGQWVIKSANTPTAPADASVTGTINGFKYKTIGSGKLVWSTTDSAVATADSDPGTVMPTSGNGDVKWLLAIELAKAFPDLDNACGGFTLLSGDCVSAWYTAEASAVGNVSEITFSSFDASTGRWASSAAGAIWGKDEGVTTTSGYIVGTDPKLTKI